MGGLPKVTVLRIVDVDDGGNVWATPDRWEAETPPPRLRVRERKRGALGIGERILARTEEAGNGWIAHPMKVIAPASEQLLGVLRGEGDRLWLTGIDKKERREYPVSDAGRRRAGRSGAGGKGGPAAADHRAGGAAARRPVRAAVVLADRDPQARHPRPFLVRGRSTRPNGSARQPLGEDREDLTDLPIVAIDPVDARDHDDAVWAEADDDPANPGGWRAIVAIADVSFYVPPRLGAGPRGAGARQQRLFPRPGGADAAGGAVGGHLLAGRE